MNRERVQSLLEQARNHLRDEETAEAEAAMAEAQELLLEAAEELAEETAPTQEQSQEFQEIEQAAAELETLELAADNQSMADVIQETADEQIVQSEEIAEAPVIEVTPEQREPTREERLAARLKGRPLHHWI